MNEPIPPEPPTPPDDARSEARSGTVGLLVVLAAAFTVSQFYRTAPAVIGPELRSGLALSPAQLGLAAGAFFIAFSLMHVPIGVLLDRYGPRRVMAAMLAIASAGAALFSQAGGAAGLVAAQLLIGAGCSAMFVGGLVVVSRRFPPARFGGLAALLTSVSGLGMVLSGSARSRGCLSARPRTTSSWVLPTLLRAAREDYESPLYFATVEGGGEVRGCAFRTPPYKLGPHPHACGGGVSRGGGCGRRSTARSLRCLGRRMLRAGWGTPGPRSRGCGPWTACGSASTASTGCVSRCGRLREGMRLAGEGDLALAGSWIRSFVKTTGLAGMRDPDSTCSATGGGGVPGPVG